VGGNSGSRPTAKACLVHMRIRIISMDFIQGYRYLGGRPELQAQEARQITKPGMAENTVFPPDYSNIGSKVLTAGQQHCKI